MDKQHMLDLLRGKLQAKGFGAPAANRIAQGLTEIVHEEKSPYDQADVIRDVRIVLDYLEQSLRLG